ncbi:GAF domain-containing protein [Chachezhania sediminis]|uniref:GAF domain-containing protein n=1 Tax=Chachezhania sediminis TaxID=2599291 RepID=UPI00131CB7A0|nr:GAF domain-containing protein [Chachezhania sediminis]
MDTAVDTLVRPFIDVSEIWVPEGDRLAHAGGNYGDLSEFGSISEQITFGKGEGLPGRAWAQGRPVVLKQFDGSNFCRTEAATAAGLSAAVAIPVFNNAKLMAVLVVLCSDSEERVGAVEVWEEHDGLLMLQDGYYGAAKHFEWVSQHTHFPRGQGLPGGVWASNTPILMRDLGSGYKFIRADSAGKAGLTTGLGIPIPVPGNRTYVLTLLSALGTPIAHRFEIWDCRPSAVGSDHAAVLIDGICAREGPLWSEDNERRIKAWEGQVGKVLGSGLPVVAKGLAGSARYGGFVGLPIYHDGSVARIVAWYC